MNEVARIDSATAPISSSLSLTDLLKVSRIGLIVSHLWVYLLPLTQGGSQITWIFWAGLAYVTVPLGLLIYGWNDYFDWDVDHISPRKNGGGSVAFGSSLTPAQLTSLPWAVALAQIPFAILWGVSGRLDLVGWLALMALGNALYNGPGLRLSRVPVLAELTATGIYLLIGWLGVLIYSPGMPTWMWVFAALSILNLQIMGALVDVAQDTVVGKRTFAVAFGRPASLAVVSASLLLKAALTYVYTGHLTATALMLLGFAAVVSRFSFGRFKRSPSTYNAFLVLDWLWLALIWKDP